MNKVYALLLSLFVVTYSTAQKKEILLIGTFHFDNPGKDLAKTGKFDVLTAAAQQELENIATAIKKYHPTKLFVEWDYDDQPRLDSLYHLYLTDKYSDYITQKLPGNVYYRENEVFQLGFRLAKKSQIKSVYGIDVPMSLPFDSVLAAIDAAGQHALKQQIFDRTKEFERINAANRKDNNLTQLLLIKNAPQSRQLDLGSYITLFNQAGSPTDFRGARLVSEWYKRNLLMYSLVQKLTEAADQRVVLLLGASHIALIKHFIDLDERFKVVELKEVVKNYTE